MVDTYHKIKGKMSGIPLDMNYLQDINKKLLTMDELDVLKSRVELFKERSQWLNQTMSTLIPKLDKIMDEIKVLGDINKLDASSIQKYSTALDNALQNIEDELNAISTNDIWKGKTFKNGYVESNIDKNTFFKPMVQPYIDAIDIGSSYQLTKLVLQKRDQFLLRRQILISEYQQLRTYLTTNDIKTKEQSILTYNDIAQLENDNNMRKAKLAQYKTKLGMDGNDKTDLELDTALAAPVNAGNVPVPPPPVTEKPVEELVEEVVEVSNHVLEQDTDDEDIKTFKFTPTL